MNSVALYVLLGLILAMLLFPAIAREGELNAATIGNFQVLWDDIHPYIEVVTVSASKERKVLFKSLENWPFLTVGYAASFRPGGPIVDGNYKPDEWTLFETPYQSMILAEEVVSKNGNVEKLVFTGEAWGLVTIAKYTLTLSIPRRHADSNDLISSQLEFDIQVRSLVSRLSVDNLSSKLTVDTETVD
jgi:hypothetical protein